MNAAEVARKAAQWWREQYTYPRFNNGDHSRAGGFGAMLAVLNTRTPTKEQAQRFEDELATRLETAISGLKFQYCLGVDYGPDHILAEACEASGMCINNSPWKTNMWILADGTITVSAGYGAPPERI